MPFYVFAGERLTGPVGCLGTYVLEHEGYRALWAAIQAEGNIEGLVIQAKDEATARKSSRFQRRWPDGWTKEEDTPG